MLYNSICGLVSVFGGLGGLSVDLSSGIGGWTVRHLNIMRAKYTCYIIINRRIHTFKKKSYKNNHYTMYNCLTNRRCGLYTHTYIQIWWLCYIINIYLKNRSCSNYIWFWWFWWGSSRRCAVKLLCIFKDWWGHYLTPRHMQWTRCIPYFRYYFLKSLFVKIWNQFTCIQKNILLSLVHTLYSLHYLPFCYIDIS